MKVANESSSIFNAITRAGVDELPMNACWTLSRPRRNREM